MHRFSSALVVCVLIVVGCNGASRVAVPLDVRVHWDLDNVTQAASGFYVDVTLETRAGLPASARLTLNGDVLDIPPGPYPSVRIGPVPVPELETIKVELTADGDHAQAVLGSFLPGSAARLTSPANGQVKIDQKLVIEPPKALAPFGVLAAYFVPDDHEQPWLPAATAAADGIEVTLDPYSSLGDVPTFTGRGQLVMLLDGSLPGDLPPNPEGKVESCTGFSVCYAEPALTLGPLAIDIVK